MAEQVFISYSHVQPDESLAKALEKCLQSRRVSVFIDTYIPLGKDWANEIELQLQKSSVFVVLLSENSIRRDMVREEIRLAHELQQKGQMRILPVRVNYHGKLPYDLAAYLGRIQYVAWDSIRPTEDLCALLYAAIKGSDLPENPDPETDGRMSTQPSVGGIVVGKANAADGLILKKELRSPGGKVEHFAWSSDGTRMALVLGDGQVEIWDVESQKRLREITEGRVHATCVAWSVGDLLATGAPDGSIQTWKGATGQTGEFWPGRYRTPVHAIAWSPDGESLAWAAGDQYLWLWILEKGEPRRLRGHTGKVYGLAWSPDGKLLASGAADRLLRLWEADSGKEVAVLDEHRGTIYSLAWSEVGVVSASADRTLAVWDPVSKCPNQILKGHADWVRMVALNVTGEWLASLSQDGELRLWRTDRWETVTSEIAMSPGALGFSPPGNRLAAIGENGRTVFIWKVIAPELGQG